MNLTARYAPALLLGLLGFMAFPAHAGCTYPQEPGTMPDGRTATREQMIAAQKLVKQYTADMDDYLKCIDDSTPKSSDVTASLTDAQKQEMVKQIQMGVEKHNAAVSAEQAVADRFNDQLKIFKSKQESKD
jgi:hypothetical protein